MSSLFAALLWLVTVAQAGALAELRIGTEALVQGQAVTMEVVVQGGEPTEVPQVVAPAGVRVSYAGQSQTMTVINGRAQRFVQFQYSLAAVEPGDHTVGPATVKVRGATGAEQLTTDSVKVHVEPAPRGGTTTNGQNVEVDVSFSHTELWQGQVVVLRYSLRSRVEVVGAQWVGLPTDHLMSPRDGAPEHREYMVQDAAGNIAVDETAAAMVVTSSGDLSWPAPVLQMDVMSQKARRRGMMDMFFRQTERQAAAAKPLSLHVRPLPPPPADFSGLVGEFELRSRIEAQRVKVGQSIDWTLIVEGDGTVEGFQMPLIPEVEGARIYDGAPQPQAAVRRGEYQAAFTVRRTVVPTSEGTLELPAINLVYFSPEAGAYQTLTAPAQRLQVSPGEGGEADLTSFSRDGAFTMPEEPEGPRPAWSSGPSMRLPWERWLPVTALGAASPGLAALLLSAREAWRRRQIVRAERPITAAELLDELPAQADARLGRLDQALELALSTSSPTPPQVEEAASLSAAIARARFAGQPLPEDVEPRVRALVRTLGAS